MKYLIPVAMLLALGGCERNAPGSPDSTGDAVSLDSLPAKKAPEDPDQALKWHVGRAGLYRLVRSGGIIDDPGTSTGKSVLKPVVELVRSTDRIPLIKGVQMYLQYRIWPLPEQTAWADLRRVLKHPAMTLPDGSVSTGSDYMIKGKVSAGQAIGYTGYGLDEDYELVEGGWVFEIWYRDSKLVEQTFTTYRPDEEERAKLEPILALGNKAIGQNAPTGKPFSRFDWPRITVGGTSAPGQAGTMQSPPGDADKL
jgi:hypothetical protein